MLPKVEIKRRKPLENQKISYFLPSILEKYSKKNTKTNAQIEEIYRESVGEDLANISFVIKFEKGKLTVKVRDPVWKNELKFFEEKIKNSINSNKNIKVLVNKIIFK
ncbi:MAG: DUF721 domain-containing protein [Chitinivibrionia bacterium]|nr:DUF721 domain-containing protein [Chitinivibrionia bacterium]